jgi:hypothetical protein
MPEPQNMLAKGAAWMADQLNQNAATPVSYRRGLKEARVYATIGSTEIEAVAEDGMTAEIQSRDFLIRRSDLDDLMDNGRIFQPEPGDQIIEAMPIGPDAVYEAMPMMGGQSWRWHDHHRYTIRIHTKRVK